MIDLNSNDQQVVIVAPSKHVTVVAMQTEIATELRAA